MTPYLLTVFAFGLLSVLLLIAWAIGKRVQTPSYCAKCKYDLSGLAQPTVCPECGADLTKSNAIRSSKRIRRKRLVVPGALFLTLATLLLAIHFGLVKFGAGYQSTPLLIAQANYGIAFGSSDIGMQTIGDELLSRHNAGTLTTAQLTQTIDIALAQQAVAQPGWESLTQSHTLSPWSTLLAQAVHATLLIDQQKTSAVAQYVSTWTHHATPRRMLGSDIEFSCPIPNRDTAKPIDDIDICFVGRPVAVFHSAAQTNTSAHSSQTELTVQTKHSCEPFETPAIVSFDSNGHFWSRSNDRLSSFVNISPLAAGKHHFTITWAIDAWIAPSHNMLSSKQREDLTKKYGLPVASFTTTHTYTVQVHDEPRDVVKFIADPKDNPQLQGSAASASAKARSKWRGELELTVEVRNNTNHQSFSQDQQSWVWIVAKGQVRTPSGEVQDLKTQWSDTGKAINTPHYNNDWLSGDYPFDVRYDELTLILVPDPEAAVNNEDVSRLWNAPIELPITIDWSQVPAGDMPPYPAGAEPEETSGE